MSPGLALVGRNWRKQHEDKGERRKAEHGMFGSSLKAFLTTGHTPEGAAEGWDYHAAPILYSQAMFSKLHPLSFASTVSRRTFGARNLRYVLFILTLKRRY